MLREAAIPVQTSLEDERAFPAAPQRDLKGHVDLARWPRVKGWVWDPELPEERIRLELAEGNNRLLTATSSLNRPDIAMAGIGDGLHGFEIDLNDAPLAAGRHILTLRCAESATEIPGSPVIVDVPAERPNPNGTPGATDGDAAAILQHDGPSVPPAVAPAGGETPFRAFIDEVAVMPKRRGAGGKSRQGTGAVTGTRILIDVSDLVYYIGHHPNLTGIQRVQSSIVLSVIANELCPLSNISFLSYDAKGRRWVSIPSGFLVSLLEDLFLPPTHRLVGFSADEARHGVLPGAISFDGVGVLDDGNPSVLCLLGAAWVQRDYLHRVLALKRRFGTRFVMTVHDLIPIYARETCDQGTARVFEEFLRRALRHVDHFLGVSENTAKDLNRYCAALGLPEPAITVTRNGASFAEFLPAGEYGGELRADEVPHRFVLFVATVEGRKNHRMMLEIWRALVTELDDPPYLVCVGRVGWKSESFIADLVETNYLNGKVILLQDISDADLRLLYSRCLFTVFPSMYEGWGLPVGESLAAGKVCVCSDRSSIPEVAGEFGVYVDIDDIDQAREVIRGLISDRTKLKRLEAKIRDKYKPDSWASVAEKVVAACRKAAEAEWREPYPFVSIPYASEIGFAWLGRDAEGSFGDDLLARIVDTRKGHFLNEPLQELSFLRGEEARAGGSWAEPEHWGTWLCRSPGEVVIGLPPSDSQLFYVFLRLRVTAPLSDRAIKISANGEPVWSASIGNRPKDVRFPVRRRTAGRGGWRLRIRAEIELPSELEGLIAAMDSRVPTIGFERLVIVPEDDLKARLDILYTLLL